MSAIDLSFNTETLSFSVTMDGKEIENLASIGYETYGGFGSLWMISRNVEDNGLYVGKRMTWEWDKSSENSTSASISEARFSEKDLTEAEYQQFIKSEASIPLSDVAKKLFEII